MTRMRIYAEIDTERRRQEELWGEQVLPMNTKDGYVHCRKLLEPARASCDVATEEKQLTWFHIAQEEFLEAFSEEQEFLQRDELIQLAAVCVQIVESLDRRLA